MKYLNQLTEKNTFFKNSSNNIYNTPKTIKHEYQFRCTGFPSESAIKLIKLDPNKTVCEIKKTLLSAYKMNPYLFIHLIFKRKILKEISKFVDLRIRPKEDCVLIMVMMSGG